MSVQETALYGDLVLALRDYAAEQLAALAPGRDVKATRAQLDEFIRTWFFTPQDELYGSAPRDIIWREQLGQPNCIPRQYAAEAFDDDCPLCQMMRKEIESAENDEAHGYHWTYCPDTCLLDLYDPKGSEERWSKELAWEAERARFRHHRDLILRLAQLIPPGARLWLSGWLEAVACGAMLQL